LQDSGPSLGAALFARKGVSRAEPLIAAKAKENQKAGGQSREVGRQKSDKPLDTKKEAAALAGVNHNTFHKGNLSEI